MPFLDCSHTIYTITGRYESTQDNSLLFAFPGVTIRTRVKNTAVFVRMKDYGNNGMNNHFTVLVDGTIHSIIALSNEVTNYLLMPCIDDQWHTIELFKRTESEVGECCFYGFSVDDNAQFETIIDTDPFIEFIGDSITCGYGIEAEDENSLFDDSTENAWCSFASVAARQLNARYALIAYSGKGIYRNWASEPFEGTTMSDIYHRTLADRKDSIWNFSRYKPTMVVINIGSNDFSPPHFVDEALFLKAYATMVSFLRQQYGTDCFIFCVTGPILTKHLHEKQIKMIKTIVQSQVEKGDARIFSFSMTRQTGNMGFGAQWHPSKTQSEFNGKELACYINNCI